MFTRRSVLVLVVPLLWTTPPGGRAGPPAPRELVLEMESVENHADGTRSSGCRQQALVLSGRKHASWIAFGRARPHGESSWEALTPRTECGSGVSPSSHAPGAPYVVLELEVSPAVTGQELSLKVALKVRKLTGFDREGRPTHAHRAEQRAFGLGLRGEAILPVLISDPREREAFGVHEVLLRLRARPLAGVSAASYGSISVVSDVPGAEILLDGGLAGRTAEGSPTVLGTVLTGSREVGVRDASGRETRQKVRVEEGATAEARLELLHLPSSARRQALAPLGKNPQGHEEYWRLKDGAAVVRVPAGDFPMGSPEGKGEPHERPRHQVHVSEFLIDKTEVTWRQFRRFAETTGTPLPPAPLWGTPDDYPVSNVRWQEAQAYCEWVGGRLPTEAEWEKAARGTEGREYPWGDAWSPDRCNSWVGGPHRPASAGSYRQCVSPYGVLDMAGSMWEWTADWYGEDYYAKSPPRDPAGPQSGWARVLRGGDWISQPSFLRTAYRHRNNPSSRSPMHGFRCVQDPPEALAAMSAVSPGAPRKSGAAAATGAASPSVVATIEVVANPVEGAVGPRCAASARLEANRKAEWWFAFSEAAPAEAKVVTGGGISCGSGPFEPAAGGEREVPLHLFRASATAWFLSNRLPYLEITVSQQSPAGPEAAGEPPENEPASRRKFFFTETEEALVPLVGPGLETPDLPGLHEVYLRVTAEPEGQEPGTRYGMIGVISGPSGAEVFLDGGFVGKMGKGDPLVLRNVPAGEHLLRAREPDGEDVARIVRVAAGRTTLAALDPSDMAGGVPGRRLVPIGKNAGGCEEYRREKDQALVVRIPAGEFLMGNRRAERQPLEHRVYVSSYLVDKTEVTWGQYKKFAAATGTPLPPHEPYWGIRDDHPAIFVTWDEARAYCEWAGGRLPTEAEWERAARGTDGRTYPWGNEEPDPRRAVFRRSWGHHVGTDPAGAHPEGASPCGLLDMGGNVWEWCADWYLDDYYASSPPRDPRGPRAGLGHVVRGGSWDSRPAVLACSVRNWGDVGYREGDFGFRCAMDAPE